MTKRWYCSFCGKTDKEVYHMVVGGDCVICDECVDLCVLIIADRRGAGEAEYKSWFA